MMLQQKGAAGLGQFFELERPHLRRFLERRINPKIASRLDASDVIQDVFFAINKPFQRTSDSPSSCH